jgi:hypothetical protein
MSFRIHNKSLSNLKTMDLRPPVTDDFVDEWMDLYSLYGQGIPHEFQYVIRGTNAGAEHYFSKDIYSLFQIGRVSKN